MKKFIAVIVTIFITVMSCGAASAATGVNPGAAQNLASVRTYKGFDISYYPGDTAVSHFWNSTPFSFIGFYLGPTPYHGNSSFMSKKSYLQQLGYGFLVLYVGRQADSSYLTYAQGQTDGANAASLANSAGFTKMNTRIFLDIEEGGYLGTSFTNYIKGWIDYIAVHTIYQAGIYCSFSHTADQIKGLDSYASNAVYYIFNINEPPSPGNTTSTGSLTPASSYVSYATIWQYNQNESQSYNGTTLNVDLDLADSADPSASK